MKMNLLDKEFPIFRRFLNEQLSYVEESKNLYENRICNQWDNWRAYGPELLL